MRIPYASPWGPVVNCTEICKGVFDVVTIKTKTRGGGVMIHSSAAALLSNYARRYAVHYGVFLCYGDSQGKNAIRRELTDNGLL